MSYEDVGQYLSRVSIIWSSIVTLNSLVPGEFEWSFRYVIFKWIVVIDGWGISCEIALIWMSLDFTDDQSTLVQVMAWCRQATSHYLSQCWPRSLSPYDVTRPECVKSTDLLDLLQEEVSALKVHLDTILLHGFVENLVVWLWQFDAREQIWCDTVEQR